MKNILNHTNIALLLVATITLFGCNPSQDNSNVPSASDREEIMHTAITHIREFAEFRSYFPTHKTFVVNIEFYGDSENTKNELVASYTSLQMITPLFERYQFCLIGILPSDTQQHTLARSDFLAIGFVVREISQVRDNRIVTRILGVMPIESWDEIKTDVGSWENYGMRLADNQPVTGFERQWQKGLPLNRELIKRLGVVIPPKN